MYQVVLNTYNNIEMVKYNTFRFNDIMCFKREIFAADR